MGKLARTHHLIHTALFRRTFLSLFALTLAIIAAFCGILSYSIHQRVSGFVKANRQSILEQASASFENRIQWTAQNLSYMLWRSELIRYMLLPSGNSTQSEAGMITQLRSYQAGLEGVEELLLYTPLQNTLFSSSSSGAVPLESLESRLERDGHCVWSFQFESLHTVCSLVQNRDDFILKIELILARDAVGTVFGILNQQTLLALLNSGENWNGTPISVCSEGRDLLSSDTPVPPHADGYTHTSTLSGWTYTWYVDSSSAYLPPPPHSKLSFPSPPSSYWSA